MKYRILFTFIAIAIALFIIKASIYKVGEGEMAIITSNSKPVKNTQSIGWHFKLPFIHQVKYLFKTEDIFIHSLSNNSQKVEIRNNIQWRIIDPLKYSATMPENRFGHQHAKAIIRNTILSKIESNSIGSVTSCQALSFDKYCEINKELLNLSEELSLAKSSVGMEIDLIKSELKLLK